MRFLFEEGDIVHFHDVAQMPEYMLLGENEEYSPTFRAELLEYESNSTNLRVSMVDDHGETVYVEEFINGKWADMYCFHAKYFKPERGTLTKLVESMEIQPDADQCAS